MPLILGCKQLKTMEQMDPHYPTAFVPTLVKLINVRKCMSFIDCAKTVKFLACSMQCVSTWKASSVCLNNVKFNMY